MSQVTLGAGDIRRITLAPTASIRDAMAQLERGSCGMVLIVESGDRPIGTITDGDVRRALLAGETLDSPVLPHAQRHFATVDNSAGRAEVLDLMRARRFAQVPIVDATGRLVGLHLLHEVIGAERRPNWAVIMAGGRGERLRPLTDSIPKPMICVAGRPILERLVLHLVSHGLSRIFLSVNYKAEMIERHFGDGRQFGCEIAYLREDRPLGTGGALSLLPGIPEHPLLVMNGDLVTQADVGVMFELHRDTGAAITVGVRQYSHAVSFGCVTLEGDRITGFEEKPVISRHINGGLYVVSPELLPRVRRNEAFSMPALVESCLARNEPVGAYRIWDDWIDVGQKETLASARTGMRDAAHE